MLKVRALVVYDARKMLSRVNVLKFRVGGPEYYWWLQSYGTLFCSNCLQPSVERMSSVPPNYFSGLLLALCLKMQVFPIFGRN